jgi:hypothetical protein
VKDDHEIEPIKIGDVTLNRACKLKDIEFGEEHGKKILKCHHLRHLTDNLSSDEDKTFTITDFDIQLLANKTGAPLCTHIYTDKRRNGTQCKNKTFDSSKECWRHRNKDI